MRVPGILVLLRDKDTGGALSFPQGSSLRMVRLTSDIPHGLDCFVAHLGLLSSPQEIHHLFCSETPSWGNTH